MAGALAASVIPRPGSAAEPPARFDAETVRKLARERAAKPFAAADAKLPDPIAQLDYDAFRTIRFDPKQALWHGAGLPFEAQFFHRGWLYKERVDIFEVVDGVASPVAYRPEMFTFGPILRQMASSRQRAISASPASACTRRSTGRTITTRSASSSAPAIFAPSASARATGYHRAASRSKPATRPARSSPPSAPSGSSGRRPARTASSSMPCSTARAAPPRCGSASGPATTRSWTWRPRCSPAPTSPRPGSATGPACSTSTAATAQAWTTTAGRCTIPTG